MVAFPQSGPVTLRANVADYRNTKALKSGVITSNLVNFDFCGPKVANQGFKPMIREGKFDVSELAIVSFLQARAVGKPLVMLPVPMLSRFQHHCISYNCSKGEYGPKDIEGRRVAVRSYSQTTGVWVRAILMHEYGVDPSKVRWASYEDAHPAEIKDPPFVERFDPGKRQLDEMLIAGEFDAAILGTEFKDEPRVKTLIPDPHNAAQAWFRKHGIVPVNHYLVVSKSLSEQRPDAVREIYSMFEASKMADPLTAGGVDLLPFGVEANRKTIERVISYAFEQGVIPRLLTVDELFDDTTRTLGA